MSATATPRQWTAEQQAAIGHRAGNLVVSASAGSGKTAVVAERVFALATGEGTEGAERIPLDRMLIVTFTEKAAREMRARIEARLREALDGPAADAARAALDAIGGAWIMTIDAFCRRVVIENFHAAGASPDPILPEASDLAAMEDSVIQGLLERRAADHALSGPLADLLAVRGADGLVRETRRLLRLLDSLDDPEGWMERGRERMAATLAAASMAELPEGADATRAFAASCKELAWGLREIIDLCRSRPHDGSPLEAFESAHASLETIGEARAFDPGRLRPLAEDLNPVLGKLMNKGVCGALLYSDKPFCKGVLEAFARRFARWFARWFQLDADGWLRGAQLAAREAQGLLAIAAQARESLAAIRKRRGQATFSDIARMALAVLSDRTDARLPSDVADRYRNLFRAVFIDEYQDTSPLQDAIVLRVAQWDDPAVPGNLFVVGDYKQSIYRFRFAEPGLFRSLIDPQHPDYAARGGRFRHIALARNFRSRPGVIEAVNALFERLMDREAGEIDYAGGERLAADREPGDDPVAVEMHWIAKAPRGGIPQSEEEGEDSDASDPLELLRSAEAQAVWTARRIRAMLDADDQLRPGDCAILLRSYRNELQVWIDALQREGLKVRAAGTDPMLSAIEWSDLLSALRVADNPFQDIPLAALMRSPLARFADDELLRIRNARREGAFHEAVWSAPAGPAEKTLREKTTAFLAMVNRWRSAAASEGAEAALDRILADTGYEAWLAGHPDAETRLGHVDRLRIRLRRCESPGQGRASLKVFLDNIDRSIMDAEFATDAPESVVSDNGAVHLLSIHAAKGLEFPAVFLPRLERRFRAHRDEAVPLDRRGGIAPHGMDLARRRQYPTLWRLALEEGELRAERSEELRLLYVAMTRARERLVMIAEGERPQPWGGTGPLSTMTRLRAASPASLLGPLLEATAEGSPGWLKIEAVDGVALRREVARPAWLAAAMARTGADPAADWRKAIERLREPGGAKKGAGSFPIRLVPTHDPGHALTRVPMKISVTKMLREQPLSDEVEIEDSAFTEDEMRPALYRVAVELAPLARTHPSRMLDPQSRGLILHETLARVPLAPTPDLASMEETARRVLARRKLIAAADSAEAAPLLAQLDLASAAWFFTTDLGQALVARPRAVTRELPFSARKPVLDFSPEAGAAFPREGLLLQGIIDAVIDEGDRAIVVDYKTDYVAHPDALAELAERHRLQIEQYARALKAIWRIPRVDAALVFLNGRAIVRLPQ